VVGCLAAGFARFRCGADDGRILRHLGLSDVVPVPRAGRAPPLPWEADSESIGDSAYD